MACSSPTEPIVFGLIFPGKPRPPDNASPLAPSFTGAARPPPPHNSFDLDLAFALAGLGEIVRHLQPQPRLRATAKGLVETDRHFRRNTALAVHNIVEGLPCHAQNVCSLCDRQIKGFDAVMSGLEQAGTAFVFEPTVLAFE